MDPFLLKENFFYQIGTMFLKVIIIVRFVAIKYNMKTWLLDANKWNKIHWKSSYISIDLNVISNFGRLISGKDNLK